MTQVDATDIAVLLIDDDEDDFILVQDILSDSVFSRYSLKWIPYYEAALAELDLARHDICLLDYRLGDHDGLEFLKEAVRRDRRIPIIFLTSHGNNSLDDEAMRCGAADYLDKAQITFPLLDRAIRHAIKRAQIEGELRNYRLHLEDLVRSRTEELTSANTKLQQEVVERRRAEEALRQSQMLLEKTFDSMNEAVIVLTLPNRTIVSCNLAVRHVFGYEPGELLRKNTATLHIDMEAYEDFGCRVYPLLHKLGVFRMEFRLKRKNGEAFFAECSISGMRDHENVCFGAVLVVRDITDRKKMEEERLRMKKLEAMGILAGGIAHDFNNLLAVIWGNLSMVMDETPGTSAVYPLLADIDKAVVLARDLIRQFIVFATGGALTRQTGPIGDLVEDTAKLVLTDSRVQWTCMIPDDLWTANVDRDQIRQALGNIFLNACEAMLEGGIVDIRLKNVELPEKEFENGHSTEPGRFVCISIRDEGTGIPKENLERIFDPYYSTKSRGSQKGMGLGLSIAHAIVKKHGGFIQVQSEEGLGTTFHIYLPSSLPISPG